MPPTYDALPKNWFRRTGRSGLLLPAISLGCWHNFGEAKANAARKATEAAHHDNCRRMLRTAFDHGITHFDLANNYGPPAGAAEERVGRILKQDFESHRDELIISTKAGYWMWPGPYGEWGSRKYLLASLDQSLKRLKLDYVDIFYSHRPDENTPFEETMGALDQAVKSGKAIYAGISSYSGKQTTEAVGICESKNWAKPVIHQPYYNLLGRWIEKDLLPATAKTGLGTIAFCPLAQGQLTAKYQKGVPKDSRAGTPGGFLKADQIKDETVKKAAQLDTIAKKRGQTLAQMALAWVLRDQPNGPVTTALIGASRPEQIVENVKAAENITFTAAELSAIDRIAPA